MSTCSVMRARARPGSSSRMNCASALSWCSSTTFCKNAAISRAAASTGGRRLVARRAAGSAQGLGIRKVVSTGTAPALAPSPPAMASLSSLRRAWASLPLPPGAAPAANCAGGEINATLGIVLEPYGGKAVSCACTTITLPKVVLAANANRCIESASRSAVMPKRSRRSMRAATRMSPAAISPGTSMATEGGGRPAEASGEPPPAPPWDRLVAAGTSPDGESIWTRARRMSSKRWVKIICRSLAPRRVMRLCRRIWATVQRMAILRAVLHCSSAF
mmetsp:Transcript_73616/g.195868  ORF Transcript_73616/g.195868 Transcript_73616/m.195868 type:complete len:275 (-) Transcript_73616:75-899(-)